jgi:hypothetical protein
VLKVVYVGKSDNDVPKTMADMWREAYEGVFEECGLTGPNSPLHKQLEEQRAREQHQESINRTLQEIFDEE